MKSLIVAALFLFAVTAMGQGIKYPYTDKYGTIYGKPMPYQTAIDILEWWDEWLDSCWADSTWEDRAALVWIGADTVYPDCPIAEKWYWPRSDGRVLDLTHNVVKTHCYHAIRRDPSNFQEFMEFIRRRNK